MTIAAYIIAIFVFVICYRVGNLIAKSQGGYEAFSTASNMYLMVARVADFALIVWGFFVFVWWLPIVAAVFAQLVGGVASVLIAKRGTLAPAAVAFLVGLAAASFSIAVEQFGVV